MPLPTRIGLENHCTGNRTGGSNPSPSATFLADVSKHKILVLVESVVWKPTFKPSFELARGVDTARNSIRFRFQRPPGQRPDHPDRRTIARFISPPQNQLED